MAEREATDLATALLPWVHTFKAARTGCRLQRSHDGGPATARVFVALDDLCGLQADASVREVRNVGSTMRSLREAMELLRLAITLDPHVIRVLMNRKVLTTAYGNISVDDVAGIEAIHVIFEVRCSRASTEVFHRLLVDHVVPSDACRGSSHFQLIRDTLRAPLNAVERARLREPIDVVASVSPWHGIRNYNEPFQFLDSGHAQNFFGTLTTTASHIRDHNAALRAHQRGSPPSGAVAEVGISKVSIYIGTYELSSRALSAIRGLFGVQDGLVCCSWLTLDPRALTCTTDELVETLKAVLTHPAR